MRMLSPDMRPTAMDCIDMYHFCQAFLSKPNLLKERPIEFNCINQVFTYDNLVPNKTIIDLFNAKLKAFERTNAEFIKQNPNLKNLPINDIFSEYLWSVTETPLRYRACDFKDYYTPELHAKYMTYRKDWEEKYHKDMHLYERVLEYKTDEQAYQDAMQHKADAKTAGGLDWRAKQCLETLQKGKSMEVWVEQELLKKHNIDIGLYYAKKEQDHGECADGIEFKNDVMGQKTGNAYLEYAESRHGKIKDRKRTSPAISGAKYGGGEEKVKYYGNTNMIDVTVESGVAKNDNSNLMVFGTVGNIIVVRKSDIHQYILENDVEKKASQVLKKGRPNQRCEFTDKDGKPFEAVIRVENTNGKDFIASKAILIKNDRLLKDFAIGHSIDDLAKLINEERERRERLQEKEEQAKTKEKHKNKGFGLDD